MASNDLVLPADVLHLICQELALRFDYATLFNCLVSSKVFASSGALNALYRIAHECFGSSGSGSEPIEDTSLAAELVQKNAILWRSITMSSLGKTLHPYCRNLRVLDLRDLYHLLDSDHLRRPKLIQWFFAGDMSQFHLLNRLPSGRSVLRTNDIVAAIGDVILNETQLLEGLTEAVPGHMLSTKLLTWAPKLTHLRRLDLSDARCFADPDTRKALLQHCPDISEIRMYSLTATDADDHLAAYFGELPTNSLTLFENMRDCHIGAATCAAFNKHGKSLRTLKLCLNDAGILGLAQLSACTSIEVLTIQGQGLTQDLNETNRDTFTEIQEWLASCVSLREVGLSDLRFGPQLLTLLLEKGLVQLHSLSITASTDASQYNMQDQVDFHTALTHQKQLEVLFLNVQGDTASLQDRTILLDVICALTTLRHLELRGLPEDFNNMELQALAQRLHELETIYITGYAYSDPVLDSLASLKNLKSLTFAAITRFTADGLLAFIKQLSNGNQGLALSLEYVDPDFALTPKDEVRVADALSKKVGGELKYQLWRDPDALYLDSDDSD